MVIAAVFGLVYGVVFAETLNNYGLEGGNTLRTLLACNLGVEAEEAAIGKLGRLGFPLDSWPLSPGLYLLEAGGRRGHSNCIGHPIVFSFAWNLNN
jgi:hypothetical protein